MIKIPQITEKEFSTKREMFDYLKSNREKLVNLKKSRPHQTPGVLFECKFLNSERKLLDATKADGVVEVPEVEKDVIVVKVVMNTTNFMDSHFDVHIPDIWKSTLKQNEKKSFHHLQEHYRLFDKVIAYPEDVKAYTEFRNWSDFGLPYEGQTQCLIFETKIRKSINPFMFERYKNGYVREHSVGMWYITCELAICDEDDEKEMDFWNKYIVQVANREEAEEYGFFWVVTEARLLEGSAVLFGSNPITPTLETGVEEDKSIHDEPSLDIQDEPQEGQKQLPNTLLLT